MTTPPTMTEPEELLDEYLNHTPPFDGGGVIEFLAVNGYVVVPASDIEQRNAVLRRIFDHNRRSGVFNDTDFTQRDEFGWSGYIDIDINLTNDEVDMLRDLRLEAFAKAGQ